MMRKTYFVILLVVLAPIAAAAQSGDHRGQGYAFVAPTTSSGGGFGLHFGAGGEGLVYKGLGVGAEVGYLASPRDLGQGVGILSPNVSYNFTKASRSGKFAPFVTGGYSLLFGSDALHAVNVGGGVNWWFKDRLGLRLEFRDHVTVQFGSAHILGVRIGLAFR
jgi:hypothetical protein